MAIISFEGQHSHTSARSAGKPWQTDDIDALIHTARTVRDEARALGLAHEAYLLHLAVLALAERVKGEH